MILASGSPRRRELLEEAGFDLLVRPGHMDETPLEDEHPLDLVKRLACGKAHAALEEARAAGEFGPGAEDTLLAADTIVWTDDGKALGKPSDERDAILMLASLSGKTHHVSTGVCIVCGDAERSFTETTNVTFHDLSSAQVLAYVRSGEPMDKAGAYGIQGSGRLLVSGITGDYFNVVGLPVSRVVRELSALLSAEADPTDLVSQILEVPHA